MLSDLLGLLKDPINRTLSLCTFTPSNEIFPCVRPCLKCFGVEQVNKRKVFPGQSYGQQLSDVIVIPLRKLRLPTFIRSPRSPPVHVHQKRGQVVLPLPLRYWERLQGLCDHVEGIVSQRACMMTHIVDAHQKPRTHVRASVAKPDLIEVSLVLRLPGGLAVVNIRCTVLAHVVRDEVAEGHAVQKVTLRICDEGCERYPWDGWVG